MQDSVMNSICAIPDQNRQAGFGLITAIMVTTFFSLLAVIIASYQLTNSQMNGLSASENKAFYIAESGIEYAIAQSLHTNNWNWNLDENYAGGSLTIDVKTLIDNNIQISSKGRIGKYGAMHTQLLYLFNYLDYSVFVSGDNLDALGYDDSNRLRFNQEMLPVMNIDSLKRIAVEQNHYYSKDLTINNSSPATDFWSDPADQNKDATIYFVEKDLTISKFNENIGGIFVVFGDVTIQYIHDIYGVIYMADEKHTGEVTASGWLTSKNLYGGVVGNTDINGGYSLLGLRLNIYYNSTIQEKFYTYSENTKPYILKKLLWTKNY
jgi:hypothetical protein